MSVLVVRIGKLVEVGQHGTRNDGPGFLAAIRVGRVGAGIERVQHAVVRGRVDHRRAACIGGLEGLVTRVAVVGEGTLHVDRLCVDHVAQHVLAVAVEPVGRARLEAFVATLATQEVDEVGTRSSGALVNRGERAVGHARVLAQHRDVGSGEVSLLARVQPRVGSTRGCHRSVAGLAVPAEVDLVVGGAGTQQVDLPVVAQRTRGGVELRLRRPHRCARHDRARQWVDRGGADGAGDQVDRLGPDLARPLRGDVARNKREVVTRGRLQARSTRARTRSHARRDAGECTAQARNHRGRVAGAEVLAAAVDGGVPVVVDRACVVPVVLIAVVDGRIGPDRPALGTGANVGEVAGRRRRAAVVGAVVQDARHAQRDREGGHVLPGGAVVFRPAADGGHAARPGVRPGSARPQVGHVVVLRHVGKRVGAAAGHRHAGHAGPAGGARGSRRRCQRRLGRRRAVRVRHRQRGRRGQPGDVANTIGRLVGERGGGTRRR